MVKDEERPIRRVQRLERFLQNVGSRVRKYPFRRGRRAKVGEGFQHPEQMHEIVIAIQH